MKLKDLLPNKIKIVGFVRPSGTGKSYRAQMVAGDNGIEYIIDDGILIKGNEIIARHSAKKADTKIETVKKALFYNEQDKEELQKAIKKYRPESILILGTSDDMVQKIAKNLDLPPVSKIVRITDVATQKEINEALNTRKTQGKHVIPVPTFQIKKEFSGYLLDPLQIFKTKGKGKNPYMSEKSIIRPTFSYMGSFTISDNVIKQIIVHESKQVPGIHKISKIRMNNEDIGLSLYIEIVIIYGFNVIDTIKEFKEKIISQIDKLTTMNVVSCEIVVTNIYVPENVQLEAMQKKKENAKKNKASKEKQEESKDDSNKFKRVNSSYEINNNINMEKFKENLKRKINSL